MVATLPEATSAPLDSLGLKLAFTPTPAITQDVIFGSFPLEGSNWATLRTAASSASGMRLPRTTSVAGDARTSPWLAHLDAIGATALARPSAFRFGAGEVVVAIPFTFGDVGEEKSAIVIAKGPEAGPFEMLRVITPSDACATPTAFTSPDRRVLGYFTTCDEGDDPTRFGRCIFFAENGAVASRCGNGGVASGVVSEGYDDEEYEEGDYGD
jgi:hypothetical protein